jgi:hypothetical protein
MRRAIATLLIALSVALGGYSALYFTRTATARALQTSEDPELAWLRNEFKLNDSEFQRVRQLHQAYLPECARMCAEIGSANAELQELVIKTNTVTLQMEEKLSQIGNLRQKCQTMMLKHFYSVSQSMPPEQGRRYLAEMQRLTSLSNMRDHSAAPHSEHGH